MDGLARVKAKSQGWKTSAISLTQGRKEAEMSRGQFPPPSMLTAHKLDPLWGLCFFVHSVTVGISDFLDRLSNMSLATQE